MKNTDVYLKIPDVNDPEFGISTTFYNGILYPRLLEPDGDIVIYAGDERIKVGHRLDSVYIDRMERFADGWVTWYSNHKVDVARKKSSDNGEYTFETYSL